MTQVTLSEDRDTRIRQYADISITNPNVLLQASINEAFTEDELEFFIEANIPVIQILGAALLGEELTAKALIKAPMDYTLIPDRLRKRSATNAFLTAAYNLVRIVRTTDLGIGEDLSVDAQSICEHAACIPMSHITADNAGSLHMLLPNRTDLIPANLRTTEFWIESVARFGESSIPLIDADAWTLELMEAVYAIRGDFIEFVPHHKRDVDHSRLMHRWHGVGQCSIPEEHWVDDRIFAPVLSEWELLKFVPESAITPERAIQLIEAYAPDAEVLRMLPDTAFTNQVVQTVAEKFAYGLRHCCYDAVSLSIVEELIKAKPERIIQLPPNVTRTPVMLDACIRLDPGYISYIPKPQLMQLDIMDYDIPTGLWHFIPTDCLELTDAKLEEILLTNPMTLALVPWTKFSPAQKQVLAGHPQSDVLIAIAQR